MHQECIPPSQLYNIYSDHIMQDALEECNGDKLIIDKESSS